MYLKKETCPRQYLRYLLVPTTVECPRHWMLISTQPTPWLCTSYVWCPLWCLLHFAASTLCIPRSQLLLHTKSNSANALDPKVPPVRRCASDEQLFCLLSHAHADRLAKHGKVATSVPGVAKLESKFFYSVMLP